MARQKKPSKATVRVQKVKIEESWEELPGDQIAEPLLAAAKLRGIDRLWFVSGSELTFFQEAIAKANALGRPAPELKTMVHEHVALSAACGDTMVTGKPSSAVAHVELGLLNMGGAIHNAYRGEFPVLMMTGYPATTLPREGRLGRSSPAFWSQQQWDIGSIVRQYTKWDYKLSDYENPALVISRALQLAMTEPKAPVYLGLPPEVVMGPVREPALYPPDDQWTVPTLGAGDEGLIRQTAKLLVEAENPVILVERMGRRPEWVQSLVRLAELLAVPVRASTARMNFPQDHDLANAAPPLEEADVVVVIDWVVPWIPGESSPSADAKIVRIGNDPLQSRIPIYEFPAHVRITADAGPCLDKIAEFAEGLLDASRRNAIADRNRRLADLSRETRQKQIDDAQADAAKAPITRNWLAYQLGQMLEPDDIVVNEMGDAQMLNRTKPGTIFTGGGASLGWGPGAALGAKIAQPDRTVVSLAGDGAYMFSVPQAWLWAARHYNAPLMTVIWNNRGYRTGTTALMDQYPEGYSARAQNMEGGLFDPPPDYAAEAAAAGAFGEKVTDPGELGPALRRGLEAVQKRGESAVIDVWLPKHVTGGW